MFHNPEAKTPTCRLQAEDSEEYGPPIQPETAVAEAIRGATEKHLRQMGKPVSAKPIMMRAEYAGLKQSWKTVSQPVSCSACLY